MIIDFEGREWELDMEHVRFQHAMVIQSWTGMSIGEWEDSIDVKERLDADGKPTGELVNPPPEWLKSVGALYWLMLAQNEVRTPITDVDFDFPAFLVALMEATAARLERAKAAAEEAAGRPDPTSPARSPKGDRPSRAPASRRVTTRARPARPADGPAIVSGEVVA
jgi:hypothetical protein